MRTEGKVAIGGGILALVLGAGYLRYKKQSPTTSPPSDPAPTTNPMPYYPPPQPSPTYINTPSASNPVAPVITPEVELPPPPAPSHTSVVPVQAINLMTLFAPAPPAPTQAFVPEVGKVTIAERIEAVLETRQKERAETYAAAAAAESGVPVVEEKMREPEPEPVLVRREEEKIRADKPTLLESIRASKYTL